MSFLERWGARPANALLMAVRQMPPHAGGSLPAETYRDVTAWLLAQNGHTPGTVPLAEMAKAALAAKVAPPPDGRPRPLRPPPEFIAGLKGAVPPSDSGPTQQELNAAYASKTDWLYHTHDYTGSRYVPANEITPENAARLRVACVFQLGEQSNFQTGPLVYKGRMYVTGVRTTVALDASDCSVLWKHEWSPRAREMWPNNRGVALKDGYLVRGTSDGYLLALNAANGELIWARRAADTGIGETFTMAPLIFEDKILIGPAGSENGISGWVGAFRLNDGQNVWRFRTVAKGQEPGSDTWKNPRNIPLGGGAVWTPLSLDAEKAELFVAVTNPAPDLPAHLRPGDNLYTNSVVVLNARTGALLWHKQTVPNDSHDWDLTQVSPLFEANVAGRDAKLVATVGKDGILRTLDRARKEALYETPVTTIENYSVPVTSKGVHACPGILGGVEWNGPAYNPLTKMLYTPAVDWCGTFRASPDEEVKLAPGSLYMGGTYRQDEKRQGWISAIDAVTGEARWKYRSAEPVVSAVTTTAGGVVFGGELTGHFIALDATSGKVLHRLQTGGPIGGGIISYEVGGRQHVAVMSGRPSPFFWGSHAGSPTVFVFTLP
jgi:alcohol dehydrogenase (cytochrome c)